MIILLLCILVEDDYYEGLVEVFNDSMRLGIVYGYLSSFSALCLKCWKRNYTC